MNWRKPAAVVVALIGTVAAGMVTPSAAFAADNGPWEIWPASAVGQCLEVAGQSKALSAQVQIWECASWDGGITPLHQRWIFRSTSDGYERLVNGNSKLCANIQKSTDANSAKIIQYTCGSSATLNDQWYPWKVKKVGAFDLYQFRSRLNFNKCLNLQGNGTSNGTDLILYTCSDEDNNLFSWTPATQA